ncbi:MAG: hypothetical protein EA378_06880 [Phycisphaerales bacterium]|nr:MAG: hypothetical protein EA378_06880 [Phycisphaerales bacterium]
MRIGDREIAPGGGAYVIAEIGVNHDGDASRAIALTEAAAGAGADAVKLQLFETDRLMSRAARLAAYQRDAGETDPFAMLRRLELSIDAMGGVVERAHALGMHAIVTVFSTELVPLAERLAWDAYKSASPDVIHRPLLEAMGGTGRPLIVSTGAADVDEIVRARSWLDGMRDRLAFLHCVSSYPTPSGEASLRGCEGVAEVVRPCATGYSDHTALVETGAVAVAHAGACILEKHLTDDRARAGPDHAASLEPERFASYVRLAKAARPGVSGVDGALGETLLGRGGKVVADVEADVRRVSRQSVVATRDVRAGEVIGAADVTCKRPGLGTPAWRLGEMIGRRALRDLAADMPVAEDAVGW